MDANGQLISDNDIDFDYLEKEAGKESKKEKNPGIYETVVALIKEAEKIKKEAEI